MFVIASALEMNNVGVVLFEKTHTPYITEEGESFVYISKEDSTGFLKTHPGSVLSEFQKYAAEELCSMCYSAGASKIRLVLKGGKKERCEDLSRFPIKKYYNPTLNRIYNLLRETRKKEYLYELDKEKFIVPIKIQNGIDLHIEYSVAKINDKSYFLAFTSLEEFNLWASRVEGYEAVEIQYEELIELSNDDDIIINVFGARYILDRDKKNIIKTHSVEQKMKG